MAMKINTKLRYGLRMLLALAEQPDKVRSTAELGETMATTRSATAVLPNPIFSKFGSI